MQTNLWRFWREHVGGDLSAAGSSFCEVFFYLRQACVSVVAPIFGRRVAPHVIAFRNMLYRVDD
jgi:hypothetical protein